MHANLVTGYTIFNPISQAEKCDKDGDYIRKWVPELKDVEGKAIFAVSNQRGDELGSSHRTVVA